MENNVKTRDNVQAVVEQTESNFIEGCGTARLLKIICAIQMILLAAVLGMCFVSIAIDYTWENELPRGSPDAPSQSLLLTATVMHMALCATSVVLGFILFHQSTKKNCKSLPFWTIIQMCLLGTAYIGYIFSTKIKEMDFIIKSNVIILIVVLNLLVLYICRQDL